VAFAVDPRRRAIECEVPEPIERKHCAAASCVKIHVRLRDEIDEQSELTRQQISNYPKS
jgi:hypothetical protein